MGQLVTVLVKGLKVLTSSEVSARVVSLESLAVTTGPSFSSDLSGTVLLKMWPPVNATQ